MTLRFSTLARPELFMAMSSVFAAYGINDIEY
jgi:hypothetical protein